MNQTVLVITGPTASGKTSLAIKLAKLFDGEIVSADSRAIFKGIDIASAKPTIEEREGVPHYGFDLVDPGDRFTASDFKKYAYSMFDDILSRKKLPILVGGTGLYIDTVLKDYQFGGEDLELRGKLESKTIEELQRCIIDNNIKMPENENNKRYLIRAIEKKQSDNQLLDKKYNKKYNYIVVGITTPRDELRNRIFQRNKTFLESGIIDEAQYLAAKYGWDSEAMTANAYLMLRKFLNNEISENELIDKMSVLDWRLAKRQITFMKRNEQINWFSLRDAEQFIISKLNKEISQK